jgi:concentrative nucleoside transporter, CNT family
MRRLVLCLALVASLGPFASGAETDEAVASTEKKATPSSNLADRARCALGMVAILAAAVVLSENRRAIPVKTVVLGLALQWAFAIFLLGAPAGRRALEAASRFVVGILDCALEGSKFVFGEKLVRPDGPAGFVFAFHVLPTVIFVAALFAVLYHLGVMQPIVRGFAWVMAKLLGASGAESLNVAASLFLGQTEAPLTIRPFLPKLTRSELLVVMVSGMAHVSGGVLGAYIAAGALARDLLTSILMTSPATIFLSKMMVPETQTPETMGDVRGDPMRPDANVLDAASRGTREGLQLALNIAAMLISFLALIALVNRGLHFVGGFFGLEDLSLQVILGTFLAPVAWLLGIPWSDSREVGGLLGTRVILNEMIAYNDLGALKERLQPRSFSIATIALCGFANLSSIGIQLGGIGALIPERRADLARLGLRALVTATLANFLSACIAGILL